MNSHRVSKLRVPPNRVPSILQMSGATLTVGTQVLTARGSRPVEDLKPGDQLVTKDFGLQKLRYIAFQDVDLKPDPKTAPVKVQNRALGFDSATYFAPAQLLTCRHPMFDMMFGAPEILVQCGDLVDAPGFEQIENLHSVTYVALGFVRRQILSCNGGFVEIGPSSLTPSRIMLGPEEARLAIQLLDPKPEQPKRRSFPLH